MAEHMRLKDNKMHGTNHPFSHAMAHLLKQGHIKQRILGAEGTGLAFFSLNWLQSS